MFLMPVGLRRALGSIITLIGVVAPISLAAAELAVDNPRIRELIPGQNQTVAYFDITNEGTVKVSLVGFASDSAGVIEIHTIVRDRDMVRMEQLSEVVLPPGKTIRFRTGGLHLMLLEVMDLREATEIQLLTSDGDIHRAIFQRVSLADSLENE